MLPALQKMATLSLLLRIASKSANGLFCSSESISCCNPKAMDAPRSASRSSEYVMQTANAS